MTPMARWPAAILAALGALLLATAATASGGPFANWAAVVVAGD